MQNRFGFRLDLMIASSARLAAGGFLVLGAVLVATPPAQALPSFARQTGQPCGACHTDFPGLTPFGRGFKLRGYTIGGGQFKTTPFASFEDNSKTGPKGNAKTAALSSFVDDLTNSGKSRLPLSMESILAYAPAAKMPIKAPAAATTTAGSHDVWVPPIAVMAITGFTHTEADQDPTGSPYRPNDNVVPAPISAFYGGAITDHSGAFAQVTYTGPGFGAPGDPFTHTWTWDNTDIRYSDSAKLGDMLDIVWGITANNNPTVQDVWNTIPAWGFPYAASTVAPTPATHTLIDGTFAAHVVGAGAYAFINELVYLEATVYKTLDFNAQNRLGADPLGAPGLIQDAAPYFRIAVEPHWGDNYWEVGAFGMFANVAPWLFGIDGTTNVASMTDKMTDIGFDTQYQHKGDHYWLTLRGSYIHETQQLDASTFLGLAANPTNDLSTLRAQGSFAYGDDNRIVLTGQYFSTWGSTDPVLYGGLISGASPNSNGFVAEIAYIPFSASKSPGWPWFNARVGLQYTYYNEFDGDKINARANNTLFLFTWLAM
jgi:hypothetical protein